MAITVFPRVGISQPYARLRKGHWSTNGLVFVVPLAGGPPVSIIPQLNAGTGINLSSTNARPNAEGINFDFHAGQAVALLSDYSNLLPTQRVTMLFVNRMEEAATSTYTFGIIGAVGAGLAVTAPWIDNKVYFDFGTTEIGSTATGLAANGEVHRWAFVAGATGMYGYRDGVQILGSSTGVTRTNTAQNFNLNAGGGTSGKRQTVFFCAVLDAEWTPTQVAEWSVNPWLMFETGYPFAPVPGTAAAATHLSPFLVGCTT